jgi:hypothetical protein
MDDEALIPVPGLVCPECRVVVRCEYSKSYLREKALVDGEVEVMHQGEGEKEPVGFHLHTVKLNTSQLDTIRDLLSKS